METTEIKNRIKELNKDEESLKQAANLLLNNIIAGLTQSQKSELKGFHISSGIMIIGITDDNSIDVEDSDEDSLFPAETNIDFDTLTYPTIKKLITHITYNILS